VALYRIGTAARLAGVEVATLRNWEQRYGVVKAARSTGGQRLYSQDDVERLRFVRRSIDGGLSAGEAHSLLLEQLRAAGGAGEAIRAEAQRVRSEVARTHTRVADEHERAADRLDVIARRSDAVGAALFRRRAAEAREHAARARRLAAQSRARAGQGGTR
jgi:DNA-binding transcriptional MerR regulator